MVNIVYAGKKPIPNSGGKTKHHHDISKDKANTIQVDAPFVSSSKESSFSTTDDSEDFNSVSFGYKAQDESLLQDEVQNAALAAAERKAKLLATLKSKGQNR